MSVRKSSTMESHDDEDATKIALVGLDSNDADNNDTQYGSFRGSRTKRQENEEEKRQNIY